MHKISIKQKIGLILFGIFLCLALLEIGLRIGGFIILSLQESRNKISLNKQGEYRIMCLGGSTTAMGGQYSYPSQLEEILNEKSLGIKFKVINKGVDSFDSSFILLYLKANLDKYSPDMVITMMGENDGSNTVPYRDSRSIKTILFLRGFRVYKLTKLIQLHIINKLREIQKINNQNKAHIVYKNDELIIDSRWNFKNSISRDLYEKSIFYKNRINFEEEGKQGKSLEAAEDMLKRAIEADSENIGLYVQLADCYIVHKRYKEAEEVLKKIMARTPGDAYVLSILGWCYREQERFAEAENMLKKAIEMDTRCDRAYWELATCYRSQGKYKELEWLSEKIIKSDLKSGVFYGFVATFYIEQGKRKEAGEYYRKANEFRLQYYNEVTRYNYQRLKEIIIQRGIKLVCVQHAMRKLEPLKKLFDSQEGIIFVDNEKIFKDAVRHAKYEDYFIDNFAGDFGHCTPKGNKLLAENIANVILKEVFKR